MKTINEFYNEAMADKALEEAVIKANKENRLGEFLTEHGVDGTAEAFEALVKDNKQSGIELSDDELEKAVGGVNWSDNGYNTDKSKVIYLFDVNEKVIVDCWFCNRIGTVTKREISNTICSVSTMYYPQYYIVFDTDTSPGWYEQDYLAPLSN